VTNDDPELRDDARQYRHLTIHSRRELRQFERPDPGRSCAQAAIISGLVESAPAPSIVV